jgi:hypothetical protein
MYLSVLIPSLMIIVAAAFQARVAQEFSNLWFLIYAFGWTRYHQARHKNAFVGFIVGVSLSVIYITVVAALIPGHVKPVIYAGILFFAALLLVFITVFSMKRSAVSSSLDTSALSCPACGAEVPISAQFCMNCGKPIGVERT